MNEATIAILRIARCRGCELAKAECCTHKKSTVWNRDDFGRPAWVWMVEDCPKLNRSEIPNT